MSIEKVLEERDRVLRSRHNLISSFIDNRVELDVAMQNYQRDILLDNDDYQLITGTGDSASKVSQVHSSAYVSIIYDICPLEICKRLLAIFLRPFIMFYKFKIESI